MINISEKDAPHFFKSNDSYGINFFFLVFKFILLFYFTYLI